MLPLIKYKEIHVYLSNLDITKPLPSQGYFSGWYFESNWR